MNTQNALPETKIVPFASKSRQEQEEKLKLPHIAPKDFLIYMQKIEQERREQRKEEEEENTDSISNA